MENPFHVSAGEIDNDVWWAAKGYLDVAEKLYELRQTPGSEFWDTPKWYVIHHLCFIASELFLKSLWVKVTLTSERDEDGYASGVSKAPYIGHNAQLDMLPPEIRSALEKHLDGPSLSVIYSIIDEAPAKSEFFRGRYPYEAKNLFPSGEEGRVETEKWLSVARDLSQFQFWAASAV